MTAGAWAVCLATSHERRALQASFRWRAVHSAPYPLFEGTHQGVPLLLLQTGIGPARARAAVAWLLAERRCRAVLSIGLSGGLQEGLAPGTIVVADRWAADGAVPDRALRARAVRAAEAAGCLPCTGPLLTVDRVIGSVEEKRRLAAQTGAMAVDMESGAIAEAAASASVPMAAVRVILDPLDEPLEASPERYLQADGSLCLWKSGVAIAAHPAKLPALWRLGRRGAAAMGLAGRWLGRFLEESAGEAA
jgi:nucleoside phosphorylase